jgi:hypothetical protein
MFEITSSPNFSKLVGSEALSQSESVKNTQTFTREQKLWLLKAILKIAVEVILIHAIFTYSGVSSCVCKGNDSSCSSSN